jgi:hypothetical protein
MRFLLVAGATLVVAVGVPLGALAAASPTFRMSIVHYVRGCHVWKTSTVRGAATTVTVKRGTKIQIRLSCPMDFEFRQVAGPRLALGSARWVAGTTRTIVFAKRGVYKLLARNIQSSDQLGLETLGDDTVLTLTIRVR